MPCAYYNEHDPYAAAWLEDLIAAGEIAPGDVDTRSILDVLPAELDGYTQCHFFAGVGIWSRALREAGWPDDRPVWTGSCPCQPFSAAGAGAAFADERHLFPGWHWLIEQHRPETVFGEQVASADGLVWADLVQATMEATGYACGFVDTCAAGFRSFHIRQRLYFAAHDCESADGGVGGSQRARLEGHGRHGCDRDEPGRNRTQQTGSVAEAGAACGLDHPNGRNPGPERQQCGGQCGQFTPDGGCGHGDIWADPSDGYWRDADWLFCRDGKWRPVGPGTFPLAHAATARMGRLRAYGNGLDLAQAAGFVRAYLERELGAATAVPDNLFEWGGGS